MTPDQERKLDELYEWMQERKRQAISYPIDDASLNTILERLATITISGTSAASLTQTYTDSGLDTHTGPKAYNGRLIIVANGTTYHLATLTPV